MPGCATGEEAYSLAILLTEIMDRQERKVPVKIFATDINQSSLQTGRAGVYPDSIAADLSESRLNRFFTRGGNQLRISGQLRDMVIFSPHNVASDPPFSNLDLVSCRNLLIYMDQRLQKRVLPLLHYSLNQRGLLFLGTSEDVGGLTDLFTALNRKWKIFRSRSCSPERHHQIFRLISRSLLSGAPELSPGHRRRGGRRNGSCRGGCWKAGLDARSGGAGHGRGIHPAGGGGRCRQPHIFFSMATPAAI